MTNISWTTETWNPIVGCSIDTKGCTNCYAMRQAWRFSHNPSTPQYHGTAKLVNGNPVWTGNVNLAQKAILKPLHRKKPTTYFVNSMGDLFHEGVPDEWIDQVFAVMALCPQHTFQILTKRAERMREYITKKSTPSSVLPADLIAKNSVTALEHWPLPNVWLGVSCEDQTTADLRIPLLLDTPAAIRFISAEPLLGPIDLTSIDIDADSYLNTLKPLMWSGLIEDWRDTETDWETSLCCWFGLNEMPNPDHKANESLDWIIVGGESGPNARPMHPDWARSLRDQCVAAGVPFHFKQWGLWLPAEIGCPPDVYFQDGSWMDVNTLPDIDCEKNWCEDWATDEYEGHAIFHRVGAKSSGRLLDGREWLQMPEVAT